MLRSTRRLLIGIAVMCGVLAPAAAGAQQTPAGWQSVKDAAGHCQLSVPADWQTESGMMAGATKEGTAYSTHFFPVLKQTTFADAREQAKKAWSAKRDFTAVEESDKRVIYRFVNAGAAQWTVILASSPVCQASVMAPKPDDATALQVVQSLSVK